MCICRFFVNFRLRILDWFYTEEIDILFIDWNFHGLVLYIEDNIIEKFCNLIILESIKCKHT